MSPCRVTNLVIANNRTAADAAAQEAQRLGYSVTAESATHAEGPAEDVGRRLVERAMALRGDTPTCLISGGEPVVTLVDASQRGLGGRNQQLALAALLRLADERAEAVVLLSAGTDGEDGPTDAAGAIVDAGALDAAERRHLDAANSLARNDAYHFLDSLDALLKTGPTGTNVCDLRVVVADGRAGGPPAARRS
ncbi:MAG: MOFRL family protein [Thermoguttaceae bacterium]